ncbi:hypothetical protein GCM10010124_34550 [Pilimelia terevasa]|uniref:EcsC protein family protein n=1 Tax=Pilimelia terevasa TaxID=53372 RepID=A0A8J3BT34_9ACTN|nr:hypothetical protein [Pilimelia terevasa]GGK38814.1 hypothetical protein GCM10010124_34550 [Pilimelia terevasa]
MSASESTPGSGRAETGRTVAALTDEAATAAHRARLLVRLAGHLGTGLRRGPRAFLQRLVDVVADVVPHLPVRDLATLQRHHDGLSGDALAARLIRNAGYVTAGVGAAGGGVAAVEWAVPPTLLTAPVLLGAETVAVVAVEVKLLGELHAVYGVPLPQAPGARAVALIQSWAQRRGFNPVSPGLGTGSLLGAAARDQLRAQLLRRFGRNLSTLAPMLAGAAVGGYLNRRATQSLGEAVRADLRRRGAPAARAALAGPLSGPGSTGQP